MAVSPSTSSNNNYQVFINHRGPDVKKTLASYLHRLLSERGFRVFLDLNEMEVGDRFDSQILGAIATSSVHIAIFSPTYAESQWCLKELVEMHKRLEMHKQESKVTIIPVFYKVKPSDLRMWKSQGNNVDYDKDLQEHVTKGRCSEQTIADWKKVLLKVSFMYGLELETYKGNECELTYGVVQLVEKKIEKPQLDVAEYPTDLDKKLQDFKKTVLQEQQQRRKTKVTKVVGIVGYGGVGKTTLAKEYFNCYRSAYSQSCFLEDVRETSLPHLQETLYQGLTSKDLNICSVSQGKRVLRDRLLGSKALVVLDDVDDAEQLKALFSPLKEALSSDSLVLLTSRNRDLLSGKGVSSIYKLSGLDREQSRSLFCMHAFQEPQPRAGFHDVVTKFLDVCDGLPLSLELYGSYLYTKELRYWEGVLEKISALVLLPEIKDRLKISYDRLDPQEKEVFLDIACFLIEEDKDQAISVWDGSTGAGSVNLQNLEENCIVQIDSQNCIRMHNHLRDLGRTLAEEELPKYHRRLWRRNDNIFRDAVIQPSVRGINRAEGVSDQSFLNSPYRPHVDMSKLQLLTAEGDCLKNISELLTQTDQLVWLCWNKCPDTSLPSWLRIQKLRALRMSGGELETTSCDRESVAPLLELSPCVDLQTLTNYGGDSGEVQHISLNGCSISEFLSSCPLQLEHLDLQGRKIKEVSFAEGFCPNLKHLNLSFCRELREVGALPTGLISLNLKESTALKKISGLPGLTDLRRLDISGCHELEDVSGLDTLSSLEEVKGISECRKLCIRLSKRKRKLVATNF